VFWHEEIENVEAAAAWRKEEESRVETKIMNNRTGVVLRAAPDATPYRSLR